MSRMDLDTPAVRALEGSGLEYRLVRTAVPSGPDPLTAGMSFLPLSGAIVVASRLTPALIARRGVATSLLLGIATVALGS